MTDTATPYDWSDPRFDPAARAWVAGTLGRAGRRVTGPVDVRVRPWSVVWRVPTDVGPVWFKANNPGTAHEAALLAELAGLVPARVLTPIAVDAGRGWSLLPDGGESLRDVLGRDGDLTRWERVLPAYAELQRTVAAHVGTLLAVGVPDHRPQALPTLFADLLDDREALMIGAGDGLAPETHERLRRMLPEYAGWCRELAGAGVAASIQHDDLHDGNVFAGPDGYRFFDWGDASVAHPFGSLLVTLRSVTHSAGLAAGDPLPGRLRDAYLEPWTDRHDRAALREAADLAVRVTVVSRSLSWRRALATADPARAGYAAAVPGWLEELLAA